jgi:hypothetical protein
MDSKNRLVGRDLRQFCYAFVSPVKGNACMAFVWEFSDIIAFLFMFLYLNKFNCFSEKRVMRADNPYCPVI